MPTFFNVWRRTVVHSYSKKMLESGDKHIKKEGKERERERKREGEEEERGKEDERGKIVGQTSSNRGENI